MYSQIGYHHIGFCIGFNSCLTGINMSIRFYVPQTIFSVLPAAGDFTLFTLISFIGGSGDLLSAQGSASIFFQLPVPAIR